METTKPKIFLGGMTQNNLQNIDELTKDIYSYFDGLIFVEHQSTDGTKELLESRKGEGEIISMPWRWNHGISMNVILTSKKLLPGDFIFFSDDLERIAVNFAKNVRPFCEQLVKHNINGLYSYGKIFGVRYYPEIQFTNATPHCHIPNPRQNCIEMSQMKEFEDPKTYRYNIRGEKRPRHSFIDHFVKYIYEYKTSNHLLVGNENDLPKYQFHEQARQDFILHCARALKIGQDVESLKKYILENELDDKMKYHFNLERYLNDFYRYHKLKHTLDEILEDHPKKKMFKIL